MSGSFTKHCERMKISAAFTLIEMLTVMAVIALLAGILLPINGLIRKKALARITNDKIDQLVVAWKQHRRANRRFYLIDPDSDSIAAPGDIEVMDPMGIMQLNIIRVRGGAASEKAFLETEELEYIARKDNLNTWQTWSADGTGLLDAWGDRLLTRAGVHEYRDFEALDPNTQAEILAHQIRVRLDDDGDGQVETPDGKMVNQPVIAWSVGPDGEDETGDDLHSWD